MKLRTGSARQASACERRPAAACCSLRAHHLRGAPRGRTLARTRDRRARLGRDHRPGPRLSRGSRPRPPDQRDHPARRRHLGHGEFLLRVSRHRLGAAAAAPRRPGDRRGRPATRAARRHPRLRHPVRPAALARHGRLVARGDAGITPADLRHSWTRCCSAIWATTLARCRGPSPARTSRCSPRGRPR